MMGQGGTEVDRMKVIGRYGGAAIKYYHNARHMSAPDVLDTRAPGKHYKTGQIQMHSVPTVLHPPPFPPPSLYPKASLSTFSLIASSNGAAHRNWLTHLRP